LVYFTASAATFISVFSLLFAKSPSDGGQPRTMGLVLVNAAFILLVFFSLMLKHTFDHDRNFEFDECQIYTLVHCKALYDFVANLNGKVFLILYISCLMIAFSFEVYGTFNFTVAILLQFTLLIDVLLYWYYPQARKEFQQEQQQHLQQLQDSNNGDVLVGGGGDDISSCRRSMDIEASRTLRPPPPPDIEASLTLRPPPQTTGDATGSAGSSDTSSPNTLTGPSPNTGTSTLSSSFSSPVMIDSKGSSIGSTSHAQQEQQQHLLKEEAGKKVGALSRLDAFKASYQKSRAASPNEKSRAVDYRCPNYQAADHGRNNNN
jgi:hypothetical protein